MLSSSLNPRKQASQYTIALVLPLLTSLGVVLFHPAAHAADPPGAEPPALAAVVRYDAEDSGPETNGNLSIGKFYRFNRPPAPTYPDALGSHWSDGAKLTDETTIEKPDQFIRERCVGWSAASPIEITFDLGRAQTMEQITVHGAVSDADAFLAPSSILVFARDSIDTAWRNAVATKPSLTQERSGVFTQQLEVVPTRARYVKIVLRIPEDNPNARLMLDEISIFGKIKNTWRCVPGEGSFHGAFPTSAGFSKAELERGKIESPGMVIDLYEKLVGKKIAMVLWYQSLRKDRSFAEIAELRRRHLAQNYNGTRFLALGWLPREDLKALARGEYDDYFAQYFKDSIDPAILQGDNSPIWFRPMNEFNAGWVPYGLDPENFRRVWRRMYNIAEQVGAASHHIFVWSPNYLSFPDVGWNKMEKYYPGDQYVDWVGLSAYPPSPKISGSNENLRYPIENIAETYNKYAAYKPFMISEGGFQDDVDRVRWVREWFEGLKTQRPKVKAVIWENHMQRIISRDEAALKLYRELVQDPYWLDETSGFSPGK